MLTLALIGLVSGMIAGISPCILPVLPVIFMSSSTAAGSEPQGGPDTDGKRDLTPFLVIAGLATSFSIFTLLGTVLLNALPIPSDTIRWTGLVLLVLIGIGMIVPSVERIIERPFSRLALGPGAGNRRGFVLGLALGAVYVPCAGPVLAAITVAGATGDIGGKTVVLTLAFALGTSIPLLGFALAGRRIIERISAFRSRQRTVRTVAGVVMIGLAAALTFNLTDVIQRAVPDYTSSFSDATKTAATVQKALGDDDSQPLSVCRLSMSKDLRDCGQSPEITGISSWFNTADDKPVTAADLKGKVVLLDFWAYSCINCQRAIPHVEAWYQAYRDAGFVVIGVHTPEYAFEHDLGNVKAGAERLGMTYPVALDNDYGTWNAYGNNSWPAEYLIDATGKVRYVALGEGDYDGTEKLIRQLLEEAKPGATLGNLTDTPDLTPTSPQQSPETYLGSERAQYYIGKAPITVGTRTFAFPKLDPDYHQFSLSGGWTVGPEDLTARKDAKLRLNFQGKKVYFDVGGTGTMTATVDGRTTTYPISGAPNIYTVFSSEQTEVKPIVFTLSPGLQVYSFTFG